MIKKFLVIEEHGAFRQNEVVYKLNKHDYGLARDDTYETGIERISVTRNPLGDYPSYTIPVDNLKPLN